MALRLSNMTHAGFIQLLVTPKTFQTSLVKKES